MFNFVVNAQVKDWDPTGTGDGGCLVGGVPTLKCLEVVFGNILFMSSALFVVVLFIMFVVGAFRYLTSLGNPESVKKAQGTLKFAVLGLILFVSAYLILIIICVLFLGGFGSDCKLFRLEIPGP